MPQMMPINWLFLLFFFISIFILFNILNFYNFYNKPTTLLTKTLVKINFLKNFYWKW
uniref:ATP synthase complex subunit 8 n=1 Tax=Narosa nigrisigna TaxID=2529979 RepID=A0A481T0Q3_9NEOP|nr:ATP synthase F0 subunit 8 [Narosa nigrisigna]QBH74716.1 ATP synthase F0 subunit 8 [Narosa nigrisigna]